MMIWYLSQSDTYILKWSYICGKYKPLFNSDMISIFAQHMF